MKRRTEINGNFFKAWNISEKGRKISSDTAIKTSARSDIQKQRAIVLKKWRDANPDEFAKNIASAHNFCSEPENFLFSIVKEMFSSFNFKHNRLIKRPFVFSFNKSGAKQVDILDIENKIIIEFDGKLHFKNIQKFNQLELMQLKDKALNSLKDEFCIIRISCDQFCYRKIDYGFAKDCIECLNLLVNKNVKGLYLLRRRIWRK